MKCCPSIAATGGSIGHVGKNGADSVCYRVNPALMPCVAGATGES